MRAEILKVCATIGVAAGGLSLAQPYDVAMLQIEGDPPARASAMALFGEATTTFSGYLDAIKTAGADGDLDALVIRLKDAALTSAEVEELGHAMLGVREAGKTVYVFAENYTTADLLVGAHADEIIIQQGGGVMLPGIYMEEMFLADTLAWAGLEADFVQVGKYKGADEMLTRSAPSEPWDQNISGLLDSMYAEMRETLKQGRGLSDAELDRALRVAWMADADTAIEAGLIDAAVDLTELLDHLEEHARASGWSGEDLAYRGDLIDSADEAVDLSNPFMVLSQLFEPQTRRTTGPTIAVLHIDGAIMDGDSTPEGPFSSASVGSRTIRNAIKTIAADDNIRGVVVRIDSPGGSAIASEVIWQGLDRLSKEKPVWVSVGSMAASGGYYIAVGGDKIYVNENSIVGSIGVVGGKISINGLLDKVHVNVVGRARGPRADLFSSVRGWNEEDLALIREKMTETYDLFTARVSDGRPGIDLAKTAEGRLFLGEDAVRLNMADEIGSLDRAVGDLASSLALDEYDLMDFPEPMSLDELLSNALGGFVSAPGSIDTGYIGLTRSIAGLRSVLGGMKFRMLQDAVTMGMLLRDEPVLLTMPRVIVFE